MVGDDDEEEDYRNYMESKKRDDPWKRSGTQRDHSIGSDFGNDGKHKGGRNKSRSPEEKPAE